MLEITDEQRAVIKELVEETENIAGSSDMLCAEVFRTLLQLHVNNRQSRIAREYQEKMPMSPGNLAYGPGSML